MDDESTLNGRAEASMSSRFGQPTDEAVLWRYMTLPALIWMLERQALFVPRLDHLLGLDPLEGGLSFAEVFAHMGLRRLPNALAEFPALPRYLELIRTRFCVSSWYCSATESLAMWKLYAVRGLVIQTTHGDLLEAVQWPDEMYEGLVEYVDIRAAVEHGSLTEAIRRRNDDVGRLFRKDISLEHEREFRVVAHRSPGRGEPFPSPGIAVEADIQRLISRIVIAPGTPAFERDAIAAAVRRWQPGIQVTASWLDQPTPQDILAQSYGDKASTDTFVP